MKKPAELPLDRRDFLKITGSATAGFVAHGLLAPGKARALPPLPENAATPKAMPTRNLGKTGYRTAIFSLGGQATIEKPNMEKEAVALVNRAIDLGVNYIDTAAMYGGPERWSERYIGQVMKTRRNEVFLNSKTRDRTRDGSLQSLERTLELLQTDHIDSWQLHNLARMEELDQIFAKGGAIEALQQAREQKMVRYLGISGHADPDVLIAAIQRFPFDTILLALNAADKHHKSFLERLLPLAVEKQMGIIGMKIPARGRILASWKPGQDNDRFAGGSAPGVITMRDALYYVLSLPVSTVIIGVDNLAQLEENVKLAREFTPLNEKQLATLDRQTEPIARQALFFRRWS